MFRRHQITLMSNPCCIKSANNLAAEDFHYYDKDGFELNKAEQKFYAQMGYPINNPILNHNCWQEPWFELERSDLGLILDHSMFLCRANYSGAALDQLRELKPTIPTADYLIRSKNKWGFDFALDAIADDGSVYEVIHVEYDNYDYTNFKNRMIHFEYMVRHTDWCDAAKKIWDLQDSWKHLKGFEQNHWKSSYLIGWTKAEYTEKSV
jgi:hypothetical protein